MNNTNQEVKYCWPESKKLKIGYMLLHFYRIVFYELSIKLEYKFEITKYVILRYPGCEFLNRVQNRSRVSSRN